MNGYFISEATVFVLSRLRITILRVRFLNAIQIYKPKR